MMDYTSNDIKEWIQRSWNDSAERYSQEWTVNDLKPPGSEVWTSCVLERTKDRLRILDVGTGPGSLAILCARAGHDVYAVDIAENMVSMAIRNAECSNVRITATRADAESLPFDDGFFDLVVCKGAFWCMTAPERTYNEFNRVLRKGGMMRIFDGSHHKRGDDYDPAEQDSLEDRRYKEQYGCDRPKLYKDFNNNRGWITYLPLTYVERPSYDMELIARVGFSSCTMDDITSRVVFNDDLRFYNSGRFYFRITAVK